MPQLRTPNIFGNYLAGRQSVQDERTGELRNQLALRDQAMAEENATLNRNYLAEQTQNLRRDDERASQQANIKRATDWMTSGINTVRQNPAAVRQFIAAGKQLGYIAPNVPDDVGPDAVEQMAIELGIPPAQQQGESPANIREWQAYKAMSPEEKKQFLEMKRTQNPFTVTNLGGVPTAFNKQNASTIPLSSLQNEAGGQATIAGAKESATTTAEAKAKSAADLPRVEQNANEAMAIIDQLLEHPGLPYITGLYSKAPIIPNTKQAAADALAQQVQGQTFLQAYQTLKGGGQITEVEGKKAEAAVARLNRAQSTKDYRGALMELKGVLNAGLVRARKQGGQAAGQGGAVRVNSPQEAMALPSGTRFITPDGREKVRP